MGLQLLLQPASSAVVFRAACSVVGVAYPAYESLKTVESGHSARHQAHQVREDDCSFRAMLNTVPLHELVHTMGSPPGFCRHPNQPLTDIMLHFDGQL